MMKNADLSDYLMLMVEVNEDNCLAEGNLID